MELIVRELKSGLQLIIELCQSGSFFANLMGRLDYDDEFTFSGDLWLF